MFLDFRDRSVSERFDTDICIIGAGATGIALAREFIGNRRTVCLVESGGLEFDPDVHQLYDAESSGYPYHAEAGRLRYLAVPPTTGRVAAFPLMRLTSTLGNGYLVAAGRSQEVSWILTMSERMRSVDCSRGLRMAPSGHVCVSISRVSCLTAFLTCGGNGARPCGLRRPTARN